MNNKQHWDTIYTTKSPEEVSWTQAMPAISLELINSFGLDRSARIIDVGGGESRLVDCLLEAGYKHITVLDISEKALEKARGRLGDKASGVQWIACDITEFEPDGTYDVWHDRAAFHFLTDAAQVSAYRRIAQQCVTGYMVIGTFATNGPSRCSGLEIKQYDAISLAETFGNDFVKLQCINEDHITPFNTSQHFLFCSFKRQAL
jgi:2-polyprenyl-3-methyl-5-hydroxy-6-metoxy-1,4-benzoquinol methylase